MEAPTTHAPCRAKRQPAYGHASCPVRSVRTCPVRSVGLNVPPPCPPRPHAPGHSHTPTAHEPRPQAPNEAYMYWNRGDGKWWIDVPDGAGAYIAQSDALDPPADGWQTLPGKRAPVPAVLVVAAAGVAGDL